MGGMKDRKRVREIRRKGYCGDDVGISDMGIG